MSAAEGAPAGVEVRLLPPSADSDAALVAALTALVNAAYALGEEGIWRDGATRVTAAQMAGLIGDGEMAVATLDGAVVGCVRVRRLDDRTGELGMLAAASAHWGSGVGRLLIGYAERLSRARGLDTMRLDLLVPTARTHPHKERMHTWYTRLGYRVVRHGDLGDDHPHLVPLLATPCDLRVYHRPLEPAPGAGPPAGEAR
jgi:GNAT superfamily N-acetyltransferase